jgi:SNF2 domain-containing protein
LGHRQIVITSYALLQQSAKQLQAVSFATAILDEARLIKNAESLRAKAACALDAKVRCPHGHARREPRWRPLQHLSLSLA